MIGSTSVRGADGLPEDPRPEGRGPRANVDVERRGSFWRSALSGADFTPAMPPPTVPAPPGREDERVTAHADLDPDVVRSAAALAESCGATSACVHLAAWIAVLRKIAGTDDLVVGAPAGPRDGVPVRVRADGVHPFRDLVVETAARWRHTEEHCGADEAELDALLSAAGAASRPAFEFRTHAAGLDSRPGPRALLAVADVAGCVRLHVSCARGAFDAASAARLLRQVATLLAHGAEQPETPTGRLRLAAAAEIAEILAWEGVRSAYPRDASVPDVFEAVAREHADAIAIAGDGPTVTYAELAARSDAVARALLAAGVGRGDRVPVLVPRGVRFVACALGAMKCGAAFVPLHGVGPAERVGRMLEACGARVGIAEAGAATPATVPVWLSSDVADRRGDPLPHRGVGAGDAAYVMFTSGSTGRPKGVEVPHRAIVRLVRGQDFATMTAAETWLHMAPASFDASTLEIWAPLLNGGRCAVVADAVPSFERIRGALRDHGVTSMWLTSALFNTIVDEDAGILAGVREILVGGEALSPQHVRRALAALPGTRFVNGYGPTENTTFTCCHTIRHVDAASGAPIAIGRPIAHTFVRILDRDGERAAVGVPGELCAAGDGLARGYLGAPDAAAARFCADPFGTEPAARMYRTGDLARWRPDGTIDFLGRLDRQVKLRGNRIELGEIESALRGAPGVLDAVADIRTLGAAGPSIVVWYVAAAAAATTPAILRAHVAASLPEVMVPAAYVPIERVPRTAHDKVDRGALPAPGAEHFPDAGDDAPPRDDVERAVAATFARVLGVDVRSRNADFFRLGGHSLLALRAVGALQSALDADLPLAAFLRARTVAAVAETLRAARAGGRRAPAIERVPRSGPMELTAQQRALWLDGRMRADRDTYNEVSAFQVAARIDADRLRAALLRVAGAHEALRARVFDDAGTVLIDFAPPAAAAAELEVVDADVDSADSATRDAALAAAARRPFDLARGPLWRAVLVREDHASTVLLVLHHLILDAASEDVLLRDLSAAYADPACALAPRGAEFADFAARERSISAGDDDRLERFWADHLAGAEPTPRLPPPCVARIGVGEIDGPDEGTSIRREIDAALALRVRATAAGWGTTPFHVYLAAFLALLRKYTGSDDLVVGSPLSLRDVPDAQEAVGYFVSPVPVRVRLPGARTFREAVGDAESRLRDVQSHARLPLDRILRAARIPHDGAAASPVQVFFSLRRDPFDGFVFDGSSAAPVHVPPAHAKFRWFLLVEERRDGASALLEFARAALDPEMAGRLIGHFVHVLGQALSRPDEPVGSLSLADAAERSAIDAWTSDGRTVVDADGSPAAIGVPGLTGDVASGASQRARRLPDGTLETFAAADDVPSAAAEPDEGGPPRDDVERAVAEVFAEVLGTPVGERDADFFGLGGHSFLAMQAATLLHARLGAEVPLHTVFERSTVARLATTLREARDRAAPASVNRDVRRDTPIALTPQQEVVRLHESLHAGDTSYTIPVAYRLRGALDGEALARALQDVTDRHEALRTSFADTPDGPRQVIHAAATLVCARTAFEDADPDARAAAVVRTVEEMTATPFDLASPPLMRATILRFAADDHALAVTLHHLVADGWSLGVLARDLAQAYTARALGRAPEFGGPAVQFVDVAARHVLAADDPRRGAADAHWRALLTDLDATRLPLDLAEHGRATRRGAWLRQELAGDAASRVLDTARRLRVTPHVVVLAAFAAALSRFTGRSDVTLGVPIADREGEGAGDVIGFLVRTALVRLDFRDDPGLDALVARTSRAMADAMAHRCPSAAEVATAMRREHALGYGPTHHVFFNYLDLTPSAPELPGIGAEPVPCSPLAAKFDLTFYAAHDGRRVHLVANYDTDLLVADSVEDFTRAVATLLVAGCAEPERALRTIPTLDPAAAAQTARRGPLRAGARPWALADGTIHGAVLARARSRPDAVAVQTRWRTWSYAELVEDALRISRALLGSGAGDGPVALLFPHGGDAVAAVVGALASGRPYLPLDPTFPDQRLRDACAAVAPTCVVAHPSLAERAASIAGHVPVVTANDAGINAAIEGELPSVGPEALAYVLTTSGSTGAPKGVLQSHAHVLRQVTAYADAIALEPGDRLTVFARYGFDSFVQDVFAALVTGARVLVLDIRDADPVAAWCWIDASRVTVLHPTPTAYRWLVAAAPPGARLGSVRAVVLGGEPVYRADFESFRERFPPGCVFVNGLGLTESTVALQHFLTRDDVLVRNRVPVGRPVAGGTIELLDEEGRVTERVGELAITSDRLALGYLGLPDLTRERFRDAGGGLRTYLTGDVLRRLGDGTCTYLWRRDLQVKIRGTRVEIGDVEAVLRAHPHVAEAAVAAVADRGGAGDVRLTAFAVLRPGGDVEDVRRALGARLPPELRPSRIVVVERIPKLASGKPDRRSLAALDLETVRGAESGAPPRNDAEAVLLRIFRDVLGAPGLGVHDDFFLSGGSSLLTVELARAAERETGTHVTPGALIASPTVARLAEALAAAAADPVRHPPELVCLREGGGGAPLFCIPGLGGSVVSYRDLVTRLEPGFAVWGLEVPELDRLPNALDRVEDTAAALVAAVRCASPRGPYRLLGFSFGGMIAWEMAHQLEAAGETVSFLGVIDTWIPGFARPASLPVKFLKHTRIAFADGPASAWRYVSGKARARIRRSWFALRHQDPAGAAPDVAAEARREAVKRRSRRAYAAYRPARFGGRVWFLRATLVSGWIVVDAGSRHGGWDSLAPGRVTELRVDCEHLEILRPEHGAKLADAVRIALGQAHGASGSAPPPAPERRG